MEPSSSLNLDRFLERYGRVGHYFLVPATGDGASIESLKFGKYGITKRHLNVRDAWTIGRNDLESVGIRPDDDPIIPEGKRDAPITLLLEAIRRRSSK